jgi:hypothetical protein
VLMYFQHEKASVEMFEHLITENELRSVFLENGLGEQDIQFIKEQIAGPCKDRAEQVTVFLTASTEIFQIFMTEVELIHKTLEIRIIRL